MTRTDYAVDAVSVLPPLPDGWIRCEERMPEACARVQFAMRGSVATLIGYRRHDERWHALHKGFNVEGPAVVAWRPLTVPEEVRKL